VQETVSKAALHVSPKRFQVLQSVQVGNDDESYLVLCAPGLLEYVSGGYFLNGVRIEYDMNRVVFTISPIPPRTRSIEVFLTTRNDDVIARLIDVVSHNQPIIWVADPIMDFEPGELSGRRFLPTNGNGTEADLLKASIGEVSLAGRPVNA